MRLLVTGGAGFIGSNFIHYLKKEFKSDVNIRVIDNLTYAGDLNNLDGIQSTKIDFIKGDICDFETVSTAMVDIDYVIHFAAETHVDNSIDNPMVFTNTNVIGTQVLLNAFLKSKVRKFLLISTDEVYGSRIDGFFSEDDLLNPSSPYSASKASSELLLKAYNKTFGVNFNITRCSNNFGPRQHREKLIPNFIKLISESKPLTIYGDGSNLRDWIFVDDHSNAILKVMTEGRNGETYNVGGNHELSNLDISKLLLGIMGKDETLLQFVPDRLGHDFRYAIDSNKILRELNFSPKFDFVEALEYTINWYMSKAKL